MVTCYDCVNDGKCQMQPIFVNNPETFLNRKCRFYIPKKRRKK